MYFLKFTCADFFYIYCKKIKYIFKYICEAFQINKNTFKQKSDGLLPVFHELTEINAHTFVAQYVF